MDASLTSNVPLKESAFNVPQIQSTKEYELQHRVQKIKEILAIEMDKVELEKLIMIDVIHRLGLEDYFKEEINVFLKRMSTKFCAFEESDCDDVVDYYRVSLTFRLLRQYGYYVSADIYNKFKDKNTKFKEELGNNVKALLSVYESCQLSTHTEELILEKASEFCEQLLLNSIKNNFVEESEARIIKNTLRYPYNKSLVRLFAKKFLQSFDDSLKYLHKFCEDKDEWKNEVQELARIDLDLAQMSYRNEVQALSKWAAEHNLNKELGFARIQPLKWWMWSLGIFHGPNKSKEIAKAVSFIYIVDDIFDCHSTYDDLYHFTQAVTRWDNADIEGLPMFMQVCFNALVKMTKDFSSKIQRQYGCNPEQCLRKLWAVQFEAYLVESRWSFAKYSPTSEEYLKNAIVTSGTHIGLAHGFFLMGQEINIKAIEELNNLPSIISSTATILRLWNDAGIHTDKSPNGIDCSYLDFYMKEHKNTSLESARCHVNMKISYAWKCLNEEYMSHISPFSKDFKLACLNATRMVPIMYSHDLFLQLRSILEH